MKLFTIIFFLSSLAFGDCYQLYRMEIEKLNRNLAAVGKNPVAKDIEFRRNNLRLVVDTLEDVIGNNMRGSATMTFSKMSGINPRSLHNILRRTNKRNELCRNGTLLDANEINNLIRSGKLF
ncbi:MAG: hypothetical protein ACHQYQ_01785 [Bacteriovoracales bacterium]